MKKITFAISALVLAGSAVAQNVITDAQGVATIIDAEGKVLQTVNIGMNVPEGSTLSTTGTVTVQVSGGQCTATLSSGQSMPVTLAACQQFVARAAALSSTKIASSTIFTPLNIVLGVGGLALLSQATQGNNNPAATTPIVTPISPS